MLTSLKNNRSLTFYQQPEVKRNSINSLYTGGVSAVPISSVSYTTMTTTNGYNAQLNNYLTKLNSLRASGAAGIIVSVSIGIIMITYFVVDAVHQRHFAEKIRIYTIEKCMSALCCITF